VIAGLLFYVLMMALACSARFHKLVLVVALLLAWPRSRM